MTLKLNEQEGEWLRFILSDWRGLSPYDGTVPQGDNPSRKQARALLKRLDAGKPKRKTKIRN